MNTRNILHTIGLLLMLCITNACTDDVTTSGESSGKAVPKFILSSAPNINSRSINFNADSTIIIALQYEGVTS